MPFRRPKKHPQFDDLKVILAQGRDTDNALYQTIQVLIERLSQFQGLTVEAERGLSETLGDVSVTITTLEAATYITTGDETVDLPNSVQLLAGTNITFDDTVPNQRTINSSGGGGGGGSDHYDAPLTDGHLDETDLIFAAGECIIVQVPV